MVTQGGELEGAGAAVLRCGAHRRIAATLLGSVVAPGSDFGIAGRNLPKSISLDHRSVESSLAPNHRKLLGSRQIGRTRKVSVFDTPTLRGSQSDDCWLKYTCKR